LSSAGGQGAATSGHQHALDHAQGRAGRRGG